MIQRIQSGHEYKTRGAHPSRVHVLSVKTVPVVTFFRHGYCKHRAITVTAEMFRKMVKEEV